MTSVEIIDNDLMNLMRGIEDETLQLTAHDEIISQAQFLPTFEEMAAASPTIVAEIGTGSLAAGAASVALPLLVGAKVETTLLNNQHWDNFWIRVGGNLNNWWHTGASYLFGNPGVSMHDVQASINLSQHITMRAVRQLYSRVLSRAVTGISNLARVVHMQQREISALAQLSLKISSWVGKAVPAAEARAKAFATQQMKAAEKYADAKVLGAINYVTKWATTHIYDPLHTAEININKDLQGYKNLVPHMIQAEVAAAVALELKPIMQTLAQHTKAITDLQTETEECTEPMCETVGPKSDWGKLLKKYKPALIFALLAELAALHPDEVARAAVDLAEGIGPVLEHWTAAYVGVLPGGSSTQPKEVSEAIGRLPLT